MKVWVSPNPSGQPVSASDQPHSGRFLHVIRISFVDLVCCLLSFLCMLPRRVCLHLLASHPVGDGGHPLRSPLRFLLRAEKKQCSQLLLSSALETSHPVPWTDVRPVCIQSSLASLGTTHLLPWAVLHFGTGTREQRGHWADVVRKDQDKEGFEYLSLSKFFVTNFLTTFHA